MIEAAQRFDETRSFKFICYAVWWIRQAIMQALAENARIVRLPLNKIGLINKVKRIIAALEQNFERDPTVLEITMESDLTQAEVTEALENTRRYLSMDAPLIQGEEENMYDVLINEDASSPDKGLMKDSLRKEIERGLNTFPSRETDIMRFYFGLKGNCTHTLEEISEEFNLTRERIRQIIARSIKRLKHTTICRILKSYLE